jgi:ribosomal protein L40E
MPPLFDRLAKGVSKAADQAKFEAVKLQKTQALGSEVSKLKQQIAEAKAAIGEKVIQLKSEGVSFPGLEEMMQTVDDLSAQMSVKEVQLAEAKAMEFQATVAPEAAAAPVAETPAAAEEVKFCPNCGAKLAEGAKFCPECGTKTA